jgi:hypothetical protein
LRSEPPISQHLQSFETQTVPNTWQPEESFSGTQMKKMHWPLATN